MRWTEEDQADWVRNISVLSLGYFTKAFKIVQYTDSKKSNPRLIGQVVFVFARAQDRPAAAMKYAESAYKRELMDSPHAEAIELKTMEEVLAHQFRVRS